jgi:hypothetical protein
MRLLALLMVCLATFILGWALRGRPESEVPVLRGELERTRIELLRARQALRLQHGVPAEDVVPQQPEGGDARSLALVAERADYERMAAGGASPVQWRGLLERLIVEGSSGALDLIVTLMSDARVAVTPQLYADLLRDVDDARIGRVARETLLRTTASDRGRPSEIRAWLDLLASHLDADGARQMIEWLGESDELGPMVARHAGQLLAYTDVQDLLGAASQTVREGPELYASLAATQDPDALLTLETMLYGEEGAPEERALLVGAAIGSVLDVAGLAHWVERFWSSDAVGRAAVLHVLAGTDGNPDLSAEDKLTLAFPVLVSVLQDPADPLLMQALRRVEYDTAFHVPSALGPLEGLRDALPVESPERAYAMRVLAKIQKSLAAAGR